MSAVRFETKATGVLNDVAHKTQTAASGALRGALKAEWTPGFDIANKSVVFTLLADERSVLSGPAKLNGVAASAKLNVSDDFSITARYDVAAANKFSGLAKLKTQVASRKLDVQLRYIQNGALETEVEYFVSNDNKLQVETYGQKFQSVKATHMRGLNELKLKYIIPTKEPVIGLDADRGGNQKWDLEYNCRTGNLSAAVKVYPITLRALTTINADGVKPPSYLLTAERTFLL